MEEEYQHQLKDEEEEEQEEQRNTLNISRRMPEEEYRHHKPQ